MKSTLNSSANLIKFIILIISVGIFAYSQLASAQVLPVATELDGYAWSSNIGWISLNCKTGGLTGNNICVTSNYKVSINTNRTVTGYAWSSNVGWIKFGGLSSFPAGGGTSAVNAQVAGTYPNLDFEGWARACAGTTSGDCSAMTSRTDGWDGWVSLKGTNHSVSTNINGMVSGSYAWGSTVVGWIDMFSNVIWQKPTATLSVGDCVVPIGDSTCLALATWNITNATTPNVHNITTNASYGSIASGSSLQRTLRLGSNTIVARDGTAVLATDYSTGNCASGSTDANGVTCEVPPPTITINSDKAIVRAGDTVTLTWTITPEPLASGSCTLSGPGLSGTRINSGNQVSSALKSKSKFSITCVGGYGTVSADALVEVIATAQEV